MVEDRLGGARGTCLVGRRTAGNRGSAFPLWTPARHPPPFSPPVRFHQSCAAQRSSNMFGVSFLGFGCWCGVHVCLTAACRRSSGASYRAASMCSASARASTRSKASVPTRNSSTGHRSVRPLTRLGHFASRPKHFTAYLRRCKYENHVRMPCGSVCVFAVLRSGRAIPLQQWLEETYGTAQPPAAASSSPLSRQPAFADPSPRNSSPNPRHRPRGSARPPPPPPPPPHALQSPTATTLSSAVAEGSRPPPPQSPQQAVSPTQSAVPPPLDSPRAAGSADNSPRSPRSPRHTSAAAAAAARVADATSPTSPHGRTSTGALPVSLGAPAVVTTSPPTANNQAPRQTISAASLAAAASIIASIGRTTRPGLSCATDVPLEGADPPSTPPFVSTGPPPSSTVAVGVLVARSSELPDSWANSPPRLPPPAARRQEPLLPQSSAPPGAAASPALPPTDAPASPATSPSSPCGSAARNSSDAPVDTVSGGNPSERHRAPDTVGDSDAAANEDGAVPPATTPTGLAAPTTDLDDGTPPAPRLSQPHRRHELPLPLAAADEAGPREPEQQVDGLDEAVGAWTAGCSSGGVGDLVGDSDSLAVGRGSGGFGGGGTNHDGAPLLSARSSPAARAPSSARSGSGSGAAEGRRTAAGRGGGGGRVGPARVAEFEGKGQCEKGAGRRGGVGEREMRV